MKKKVLAIGGLCALAVVGGTLAYFNQTTSVNNPFNTTSFEGTTVEKFNPTDGEDWKPGVTVDKDVYARNTGDGDVWVRIKLDEKWGEANNKAIITSADEAFYVTDENTSKQLDAEDGKSAGDGTVVYKTIDMGKNWTKGIDADGKDDGWYYYKLALKTDEKTDSLLKDVTLCLDTDMGKYNDSYYYKMVDKDAAEPAYDDKWTAFDGSTADGLKEALADLGEAAKGKDVYTHAIKKLDTESKGYANDNYTLTITTEFIQADEKAARTADWHFLPGITPVNK